MNFIPLIVVFLFAFMIQYALTFIQIKSFNLCYARQRRLGRVAIGKVKGCFRAGCIAMFAINEEGNILEGAYMQGVTVFARCRKLNGFEGMAVGALTKADCQQRRLSKPITRAILEVSSNYRVLMSGGEIETPPSNFERVSRFFKKHKRSVNVR